MRFAERLVVLEDTLKTSPRPPGFAGHEWGTNAALTALRRMVTAADAEATKASSDPLLPEGGRLFRVTQIKAELIEKIGKWRTEHLVSLDEKIAGAIPAPPASTLSPAAVAQLVADFDRVDPVHASHLYQSAPADVARVLEGAPWKIEGAALGQTPRVVARISPESKARRWYSDAPQEARDRYDGLVQIRGALDGAASLVEAALREREE